MKPGRGRASGGRMPSAQAGVGVIVAGVIFLIVGVFYLNRSDEPLQLGAPAADGVTPRTGGDGRTVEIPPSQPAGVVSFGAGGVIRRPEPVLARVVDRETGDEVLVALPPDTSVDVATGAVTRRPPRGGGPTTVTTARTTTTTSRPGTPGTTTPPATTTTTAPPPPTTTTTTAPPPTTTTTTTTTAPPPTTTTTQPPPTTEPGPPGTAPG